MEKKTIIEQAICNEANKYPNDLEVYNKLNNSLVKETMKEALRLFAEKIENSYGFSINKNAWEKLKKKEGL
jgi:hypothetical protein